ncbi:MAG: DUF202 domain-containing protein [Planctomycetes bacterium]|nr:DUF202 domain-containing protein [Planctomycetota bacterium]
MSNNDNLEEIYSQHWQHIRHIANERTAFTSIYLAFLGVGLTYIFRTDGAETRQKSIILVGLLFFSVMGFFLMVRSLVSYWYHYTELRRITPILCPGETLDYEGRQEEVENQIKELEKPFWWLNKTYIFISKKGGLLLPLTLIFPSIFLLGFIITVVTFVSLYM